MDMMIRFAAAALAAALMGGAHAEAWTAKGAFSGVKPMDRASVDIKFPKDLRRARGITFELTVSNAVDFSTFTCYMHSGGGWYYAGFAPGAEGVKTKVSIDKSKVNVEGRPDGWGSVDAVRISGWRGGTNDASFTVSDLAVDSATSDVIVLQALSCLDRNPAERKSCTQFAARLADSLRAAGLDCHVVSDADLDDDMLGGIKLAMLPYNPQVPDAAIAALGRFSARGGKMFAAYNCDPRILSLLGISQVKWRKANPPSGRFGGFVRNGKGLDGQPLFARQGSWATMVVKPSADASVVAWWGDAGRPSDIPALVRIPRGIYMGHVWLGGVSGDSLALVKSFMQDMLPEKRAVMESAVAAAETRERDEVAWVKSIPPSANAEFRAFWCHSPLGLGGGRTWDESIAFLKKNGFNAMLANLAWGGSADYPSEVLPRTTPDIDAFAACKAACLKHGVRFHVWKVCWNLGGKRAPSEFVERLKKEGRLQVSYGGKDEAWLCPSHPANLKLETDAFVELARKGPHGIHFDYIRYPDRDHCFCAGCRERFERKYGAVSAWPSGLRKDPVRAAQWTEFRKDAITALVRNVAKRVRAEAPGVEISAAVFENISTCPVSVGQDWPTWCVDGLLDFVCPMDYTDSTRVFSGLVERQMRAVANVPIYPGIGLSSSGVSPEGRLRRVAEQIVEVRKAGCRGFTVFNFDSAAEAVLPVLSQGPTAP